MLTQERLKELFSYNLNTGAFIRLKSAGGKLAGSIAGNINKGYVEICIDYKTYGAHRLAWLYFFGSFPDGHIDHIDHNPSNNEWINIRKVNNKENHKNRKLHAKSKFGIMGVSWFKRDSNWRVRIMVEGKEKHLGYFDNFFDACCARKASEIRYGFHENHGAA